MFTARYKLILSIIQVNIFMSMPWLRRLVADLSLKTPGFDLREVNVRFVAD